MSVHSSHFRKNSIRLLLVTTGVASFLCVGFVAWRISDNRAQQQELLADIDLLSTQGSPVNVDGVKKLHESSTNRELTDEWNSLFDELTSIEFLEATESFPYLGNSHLKDDRVPPRGQPWEAEAGAIKFLTETKSLRENNLGTHHFIANSFIQATKPPISPKTLCGGKKEAADL